MKRSLLVLILLGVYMQTSYAQTKTSPAQTLRLARATFEQGRLHELERLLENLQDFSKSEKVEAYKLLTQTYIYLEEPEKADQAMLNLLQTDHYFEVNEAVDPAEFVALYKTFRTTPVYRFGAKLGAIASMPNVSNSIEATDGVSKYKRNFAFMASLSAEFPLTAKLTFNPEIGYQINRFTFNNSVSTGGADFSLTADQKLNYISLPLALQYKVHEDRFNPYALAGIEVDYLLSGSVNAERKRTGFQPIEPVTFDIGSQREALNISALVGAGIKLKAGGGFAVAEVRYRYGITKVNTNATSFDQDALTFNYHYVDSIFKINALSFTLGYVHNIFNPKKLNSK